MKVYDEPVVSIIVPVYNAEKYLVRCLDSLINQSLKDIEIILIDDGSSDSSPTIVDSYASKDKRVTAIHSKTEGVSSARNKGLKLAKGKFVGFADSDDYIDLFMYERMVEVAERTEADCVQCEFETVYDSGKVEVSGDSGKAETYGKSDAVRALMNQRISNSIWNKIFRRSAIEGLRFFEQWYFAEDLRFIVEFLNRCDKMCTIPDVLYHYYAWKGSLAHKDIRECNLESLEVYDILREIVGDSEFYVKVVAERELKDSLTVLNAAVGHGNIRKEAVKKAADRVYRCRAAIKGNSYISNVEKLMARMVCLCPGLYVFAVTCVKRVKGIR